LGWIDQRVSGVKKDPREAAKESTSHSAEAGGR
jgi:hypothetical protein